MRIKLEYKLKQIFFESGLYLLCVIMLFLAAMISLKLSILTSAISLFFSISSIVFIVIGALMLYIRINVKRGRKKTGIRAGVLLISIFRYLSIICIAASCVMIIYSVKISSCVLEFISNNSFIMERLENSLPEINLWLKNYGFLTFESMKSFFEASDVFMAAEIIGKVLFVFLAIYFWFTAAGLKNAKETAIAFREILEDGSPIDEVPIRMNIYIYIHAILLIMLIVLVGFILINYNLYRQIFLSLLFLYSTLCIALVSLAMALKRYRDERLLFILQKQYRRKNTNHQ